MKKIITFISFCLVLLSACSKNNDDVSQSDNSVLIGSWSYSVDYGYTGSESTYIFYEDYTVTMNFTITVLGVSKTVTANWQYEYYEDKLIIIDSDGRSTYKIQVKGDTMILTNPDGESTQYTKF